jgi:hypothetical protein
MYLIIIITAFLFILQLILNYFGCLGRIERKNQITGEYQDLGPVSEKEEIAFFEGRHKKIAFYQAFAGAFIWSLIAFFVMYFIFIYFIL